MSSANPNIRIFISSTFLDMQNERDILNQDVFPLVRGKLEKLGINFTVIDLRWGITEEEQMSNSIIELCLDEITHCKPYFIGLIGNRYGWCPDCFDENVIAKYPFLAKSKEKSITELEMTLGALASENKDRCFFYFKDESLFDESADDHKEGELKELKRKVTEERIKHHGYASFDEFKESVLADLLNAIEEDYPCKEATIFAKQEAYLSLCESKHVSRLFFSAQALDIISYGEENHVAVLAYAKEKLGKSMVFNHLINAKKDSDKIIINLKADRNLQYFPAYGLFKLITKGLENIGIELETFEELPLPETAACLENYALAYLSVLKMALYNLKLSRPLYILINDIDLLFDNDISQAFVRNFLFDDNRLPENLFVFLTSSSEKQKQLNEHLRVIEMHEDSFGVKEFFKDYLAKFAKKIEEEILQKACKTLSFYDYKLIGDYLIHYCNYSSYRRAAEELLTQTNSDGILRYILDDFLSSLSPKCASIFAEILLRLSIFELGMSEDMLFSSYNKKSAIEEIKEHQVYVDISEIEKASIMRPLRYFTDSSSGNIILEDSLIKEFFKKNVKYLFDIVSASYEERSLAAANELFDEVSMVTKYGKSFSKEEYLALLSHNEEKSRNIAYAILDPLSAYLDKALEDYTRLLDEDSFYVYSLSDKEIEILSFVEESARIYRIDTRLDLYQKLLGNRLLMLFVACKSKSLLRRLIDGYIKLYEKVLQNQYGKVRKDDIRFSLETTFSYLGEKYDEDVSYFRDSILSCIGQTLYENDMYQGKLIRLMEKEDASFMDFDDYVFVTGSDDAYSFMCEIENTLCDEVALDELQNLLRDCYQRYFEAENIHEQIMNAYYYFRILFLLVDNQMMREADYQGLLDILREIPQNLSYCFFPEVLGYFDMFFGRLYPDRLLYRLRVGLDIMKYLGYQSSIAHFEEAYSYLKK